MSFSCGFYNSQNHDRMYDAVQISQIFDGIINDGVYATYGDCFITRAGTVNNVIVGSGRAWFNHSWNLNDADLSIDALEPELLLKRIDALVIDINSNVAVRDNAITWVKGTPSSNPVKPTMIHETDHNQYPICYVTRNANVDAVDQADIENAVGTELCPFVTGIIDTISTEELTLQWQADWLRFIREYEEDATNWTEQQRQDFLDMKRIYQAQLDALEAAYAQDFQDWFATIQYILDGDVAGHLQNEIDEIAETEFLRYYNLFTKETNIVDATDTITSTTAAATMTTRIAESANSTTIITTIVPNSGAYDYIKTTVITETSTGDNIQTTYSKRGK